mmetsp:Transcript_25074/g.48798  ORF Transcript_25074/g.48798 Transcript_25074/m.48798 type:complete len:151 (-) Transcript_25074:565-1017(-)
MPSPQKSPPKGLKGGHTGRGKGSKGKPKTRAPTAAFAARKYAEQARATFLRVATNQLQHNTGAEGATVVSWTLVCARKVAGSKRGKKADPKAPASTAAPTEVIVFHAPDSFVSRGDLKDMVGELAKGGGQHRIRVPQQSVSKSAAADCGP